MSSVKRGFTLIELLVVIAIIGLLSSVVLASLNKARAKGRDSKKLQDLGQLRNALELFYAQNKAYPITDLVDPIRVSLGNCTFSSIITNSAYTPTPDWIPGLVASKFIAKLPEINGAYTSQGGGTQSCYIYISNGADYKLSNLRGFEQLCPSGDVKAYCQYPMFLNLPYTSTLTTEAAKNWLLAPGFIP